eukprot:Hpha_TRINITY_DN9113_c0_g1::TRINITY_DN9113_c0_g1_i1::g.94505::m.94505
MLPLRGSTPSPSAPPQSQLELVEGRASCGLSDGRPSLRAEADGLPGRCRWTAAAGLGDSGLEQFGVLALSSEWVGDGDDTTSHAPRPLGVSASTTASLPRPQLRCPR